MEKAKEYTNSSKIFETINRVRIWMRVVTLAEITIADGRLIDRNNWIGKKQAISDVLWP